MKKAIVDLIRVRRWTLCVWTVRRGWTLWPDRSTYWSGKLIHRRWLCFELIHDIRTDVLGDMFPSLREESPPCPK